MFGGRQEDVDDVVSAALRRKHPEHDPVSMPECGSGPVQMVDRLEQHLQELVACGLGPNDLSELFSVVQAIMSLGLVEPAQPPFSPSDSGDVHSSAAAQDARHDRHPVT